MYMYTAQATDAWWASSRMQIYINCLQEGVRRQLGLTGTESNTLSATLLLSPAPLVTYLSLPLPNTTGRLLHLKTSGKCTQVKVYCTRVLQCVLHTYNCICTHADSV